MADVESLASKYEAALAASQDNPDDEKKRAAADKAGRALQDAREDQRIGEGRPAGMRVGVRAERTDDEAGE